jgi:hypothetical protein
MNMVLSDTPRNNANKDSFKAIFWVLFVGGVAAGVRPERDWFISYLSTFIEALDLQLWEDAEPILSTFLWPKGWQGVGQLLWVQLQKVRTTSMLLPLAIDTEPGHDHWSHLGIDDRFAGEAQ